MTKTTSLFLMAGFVATALFTSCSPKVAESATSTNGGSGSSSSAASQNFQPMPGESRHSRDPKLKSAEDYFKKDPRPIGLDGKPR